MATIQLKRGVEADRSSVTPASGEMLYTTDTKLVYVGDGSTAGGNPVGVGGGNVLEATASGALASGDLVIVNSDGTVSVVGPGIAETPTFGAPTVFESATITSTSAAYDASTQTVVIVYRDGGNSNYGTAVVGTVSGTSISFGTPVVVESIPVGAAFGGIVAVYDETAQKVVVAYDSNSTYGRAKVGTVSGTTISFGSFAYFNFARSVSIVGAYDSSSQKVVIHFANGGNSFLSAAVVGTVSGTSISFGSVNNYGLNQNYASIDYDSNAQKVVVAYRDDGNSYYGTAVVGTVSGTSISFATPVVFSSSATATNGKIGVAYDADAQKNVIAYTDNGNSGFGTAIVGTVSGTSISFGTASVFESALTIEVSAVYDANAGKVLIFYADSGNSSYGTVVVGTVSGTSISLSAPAVFESSAINNTSSAYDANAQKVVVAYRDGSYGTAVVANMIGSNLTTSNFVGISDGAYADTATATIQVKGSVDDAQSSLTAGQAYYVQGDNTLSTTPDSPSVLAGTAVSATEIIVKG